MIFFPLLLALSGSVAAQYNNTAATTNKTIQYNDLTQINYQPPYVPNDNLSSWRFQDSEGVSYTNTTGANFTIHFTGNSIALYASKKHDRSNLRIVIDGKDTGYANQHQDVGTGPIAMLYQYNDLENGPHTFVGYLDGTAANSVPNRSFVALSYLVVSSGSGDNSSTSGLSNKGIIGIAVGGGAAAAVLLAILAMCYVRRRRRSRITYESPQYVPASSVVDAATVRRNSKPMGQITPLPINMGEHNYPLSSLGESLPGPAGGIPYDSVDPDHFTPYGGDDAGYFPSNTGARAHQVGSHPSSHSYTSSTTPALPREEGITWSPPASPRDELLGFMAPGKGQAQGAVSARRRTDSWSEAARFGSLPVPGSLAGREEELGSQQGSQPPPRYEQH